MAISMVPLVGARSEHKDNEANIVQSMKAYQRRYQHATVLGAETAVCSQRGWGQGKWGIGILINNLRQNAGHWGDVSAVGVAGLGTGRKPWLLKAKVFTSPGLP